MDEYAFLSSFVSEDLIFHTANGSVLRTREEYVWRPPALGLLRSSSGSASILHLAREQASGLAKSVLLSTIVHTQKEGARQSVVNLRSFVKQSDSWVCRLWLNYIGPQPNDADV